MRDPGDGRPGVAVRVRPDDTGDSDVALMERVAGGDGAAFRLLVDRYTARVHGLAWRLLGDAAEAEDVVQEVFTKLWVGAPRWTSAGGGLGAWLRRIATNASLDRLRRRRFVAPGEAPEGIDETPGADVMIDEERRAAAVAAAILALPDRQRAAIVLTYHEELPNAEAADLLGIKVKAMESLLVRARQALTRTLAEQGLVGEGGPA